MATATTVLHVRGHTPSEVERALDVIFAAEDRPRTFRLEGTYSAVLKRLLDPSLEAPYQYLICRPHPASEWNPLLELGNRTEGLDRELSRRLGGCAVVSLFNYGEVVSGYRVVANGIAVDQYVSDPTYNLDESAAPQVDPDASGHPEKFADLLPTGTAPADFIRIVLRPGWWEEHEADLTGTITDDHDSDDLVDESDRMRCIGLALELWGPHEYPFWQDADEIPDNIAGPALAMAFQ